jgi:hypothetical protein
MINNKITKKKTIKMNNMISIIIILLLEDLILILDKKSIIPSFKKYVPN